MKIFKNLLSSKEEKEENLKELETTEKLIASDLGTDIVNISENNIIDTTSPLSTEKYWHNIAILKEEALKKGKITKFILIRETDNFPTNYEWLPRANTTTLEKTNNALTYALAKSFAMSNIEETNGIAIPKSYEEEQKELKKIDYQKYSIYSSPKFRSTKHFTINTPLGFTGDYNIVNNNRNFIILDTISAFLSSGYGYSVDYQDAYLDVSHKPLAISKKAIILMNVHKYNQLDIKEKEIINQRKLYLFTGDENLAINMLLTELGVLPSKTVYDKKLYEILENSMKELAKKHHLHYKKSHGGKNGHFTDYIDSKNTLENDSFVTYLKESFPDYKNIINISSITNDYLAKELVNLIGKENLAPKIAEYNKRKKEEFLMNYKLWEIERQSLTEETNDLFKMLVKRIALYYESKEYENYSEIEQLEIEKNIISFFHGETIRIKLTSATNLYNILNDKLNIVPKK